jgi:hypothetical protein
VVLLRTAEGTSSNVTTLRGAVRVIANRLSPDGTPLDPEQLALEDFHLLRIVLTRAGLLPEEPVTLSCENCNEPASIRPSERFEPGPYIDGELQDPELDEPFPFDKEHELPGLNVRLGKLTIAGTRPLHDAVDAGRLRVNAALVRAMGIESVDGITVAAVIARKLQRLDDAAWDALTDLFDAAYYGPRTRVWWRCEKCGARNEAEAPTLREFPAVPLPRPNEPVAGFPDEDAFEALVRKHAPGIFARKGVRNLGLLVEVGVAECDSGGVPLLGSYEPGEPEASGVPAASPEIRLYYRTFRAMYADEPYDLEAELAKTIEHEVDHHLAWLSGHDPQDEHEQEEIANEQGRMVGKSETTRRAAAAAGGDLMEFVRKTWLVWVLVAIVSLAAVLASK